MKPTDQARWQGVVESWLAQGSNSAGIIVNPVNLATMADSGQLAEGWYDFDIVLAGSATHFYELIQHRNAANSASLYIWYSPVFGGITGQIKITNWYMVANERLRVININLAAGSFGVTVSWVRRA